MADFRTEYDSLLDQVSDLIHENKVDGVTVRSLYQSSFEFEELTPQVASVAVISASGNKDGFSIKPLNIKISFKFALDAIFMSKPLLTEKGIWLILSLLRAICFLLGQAVKTISKEESVVIFALYRLRQADIDRITEYIDNGLCDYSIDVKLSLEKLTKLNVVDIEDGKYYLKELIIIKND